MQYSLKCDFMEYQSRYVLARLEQCYGKVISTGSPSIYCSQIPDFWRSKKSLPDGKPFKVFVLDEVADGTEVALYAGNKVNCSAELRNNSARIKNNVAVFEDLRFVGCSGKSKCSLRLVNCELR